MTKTLSERLENLSFYLRRNYETGVLTVAREATGVEEEFNSETGKFRPLSHVARMIDEAEATAFVDVLLVQAVAERDALQVQLTDQAAAHAEALQAAAQDKGQALAAAEVAHQEALTAAQAAVQGLENEKAELLAEAATAADDLTAMTAARDALQAQVDELTAPSAVRKVLNYRFKLALNTLGVLPAANALVSVSPPEVGIYWGGGTYGAGAPEFYIDDPLLLQMAAALIQQLGLTVTLTQVFDLADTYR